MSRDAISAGDVPLSHLPFSPAVRAGDLLFVSGQASVDDTGAYTEGDFAAEMERSMRNVERILAAAGATMDDVVQVRSYLGDMAYRDEYNNLYSRYFTAPLPARTTVAGGIGNLKFEIDVVAYLSN